MQSDRKRILVVDDNTTNVRILAEALKSEFKVSISTTGERALELAVAERKPDLILLDVMMPGLNGYEVCKRLKQEEQTAQIPVIFLTSNDRVEDEELGLALGAVDYITKPFSLPIVKARIRTHLELKRHRDHLKNLSQIDGLTGIANRRRFDEIAELEWRRACRNDELMSIVMLDIDYFKKFNDTYGHLAGDSCLKTVAGALSTTMNRASDFLARYGGEEFAVILPGCDSKAAMSLAEAMRHKVEELTIPHEGNPFKRVTISLGVASMMTRQEKSYTDLVEQADQALYAAKSSGRNRVMRRDLLEPVNSEEQKNSEETMSRLRNAVKERRLSEEDWQFLAGLLTEKSN